MRVALLCLDHAGERHFEHRPDGGAYELGRALAAAGHEIHLFESTPGRSSQYRQADNLHCHIVSIKPRNGTPHEAIEQSMLYYLRSTQNVAGLFDVVHCFDNSLLPVAGQSAASSRTKAFLSIASDQAASASSFLPALHQGWSLEEAVDGVVVPNRSLKNRLVSQLGLRDRKVVVLRPGVEMDRYSKWVNQGEVKSRYKIGPLDPMVLFVGELCPGSGADLQLEALFVLIRQFDSLKVIFAGDGPLQPYLKERAKVLGIDRSVRFLNFVPENQLIDLYNGCNLVFVPGGDTFADKIILEAWSAGKPTLVFREALPEFVEAGIDALAVETDCGSIAEALRMLLTDPARATALGHQGWDRVSREFSWRAIANRTLDMYSNATSRRMVS